MRFCPTCGARFSHEASFCPQDGTATQSAGADADEQEDRLLGAVVDGRYKIERAIGEGGMGVVYVATHVVLGKRIALKVLRGEMARDPDVVRRFVQEAQAASSIGHPNIVDISDFGQLEDGSAYFAMEYLDGEPLTALIERGGSLPTEAGLQIVEQIAAALGSAHARGIVHRDLKPDNIYLIHRADGSQVAKVLDFGIAKVGGAATKLTKTGIVFGTPHYMSPEQAAGHGVDLRTDIYALGIIMYEMFTGRVPFDADTFMGILSKHMFESPVPPSRAGADPSLGALEGTILRALSKKPEERQQNMQELLQELQAVRDGGAPHEMPPAEARGPGGESRVLANALEPPSNTEMQLRSAPAEAPAVPKRRAPLIIAAVGGLVVAGTVLAVVLSATGTGERAQAEQHPSDEPTAAVPDASQGERAEGSRHGTDAQPDARTLAQADEPADAGAPNEPARERSLVMVRSHPSGAQVLVEGAVVANTPARLPLPEGDERRELELRLAGHRRETVILEHDSPAELDVELERRRSGGSGSTSTRAKRRNTRATSSSQRESSDTPSGSSTGDDKGKREGRRWGEFPSEVVDPWAE